MKRLRAKIWGRFASRFWRENLAGFPDRLSVKQSFANLFMCIDYFLCGAFIREPTPGILFIIGGGCTGTVAINQFWREVNSHDTRFSLRTLIIFSSLLSIGIGMRFGSESQPTAETTAVQSLLPL